MVEKRSGQVEYTLATHAIENLIPSREALRLCSRLSQGEIDVNSAIQAVLNQYGLKKTEDYGG